MTAGHSEPTTKAMPKAESVPIFIALALMVAVIPAVAFSALGVDSDASLRRKIVGTWQICPKDQPCIENVFTADGKFAMKGLFVDYVMELRGTWTIHNGNITCQLKGGGDWLSSTVVGLAHLFGTSASKVMHLPIRFEGGSVMYIGDEKFVRIGNTSQ